MSVRPLAPRDIEPILAIQAASPEIAQWTSKDYAAVAACDISVSTGPPSGQMFGWIAESSEAVQGFLVARRVASDVEVLNLAVHPGTRLRGVGSSLLQELLAWSGALGSEKIFLEVRASNAAAIRFYARRGFELTGRRQRYYTGPVDDALLFTLALK